MGRGRAPRTNWQLIPKENKEWEDYYRHLKLPSGDPNDFDNFKKVCQSELPVTFRITGTSKSVLEVKDIMEKKHISKLDGQIWEGKPLEPPKPLPFYPNNLAWQVNVGKQVVRRQPSFNEFQRFLVVETNAGNVSRQELVSMIPPLFLGVEPHHIVLDTCASPGSKTAQLLEALHRDGPATGLVIANDSDYKRSHMLTHQIKRLNSPNVIVTHHDAQMFPKIWLGGSYLKFDRILCDVPCTGDATMRKNINVWKDWKVSNGQGLHQLQLNITSRSVHLLKNGGRLVYSTCSLNPTENEAVVAQLLRQFPNLRLVDVSSEFPELKRTNGISNWQVLEKKTKKWFDLDDTNGLPRSWFRPTDEECEKFHLERSIRVYPEQQNSGGFFIAVLELNNSPVEIKDLVQKQKAQEAKVALRTESNEVQQTNNIASEDLQIDATIAVLAENKRKMESTEPDAKKVKTEKLPRDVPAFEEPFKFVDPQNAELQSCVSFYGIKPEFNLDTMVVRNSKAEPSRTIYYVSPSVKPILENNEQKLKVIHSGIKVFNAQKNDGECKWRVQIEGINMLSQFATKRVLRTTNLNSLKELCLETFIRLEKLKDLDLDLYNQVFELSEGCCIWNLNGYVYPLWRGKASVNLMAPKEITEELLLRLFDIDKKSLHKNVADSTENQRKEISETSEVDNTIDRTAA